MQIACDPTYEMVAGDSQLTCDADRGGSIGVWVGDLPTCQQIQCTVPIVQDATVSPASGPYFYSDLITFTCTIGYTVISGKWISYTRSNTNKIFLDIMKNQ